MKASKKAKARAKQLGEKSARASVVQGDLYSFDPVIREVAWQSMINKALAKPCPVSGDQLAHWESIARSDPDPGIREFYWSEIFAVTGGAR